MVVSLVLCPFQGVGISCTRSLSGDRYVQGVDMSRGGQYTGPGIPRIRLASGQYIHPTRMLSCFTIRSCITR